MARSRNSRSRRRARWAVVAALGLGAVACGAPGSGDDGSVVAPTSPTVPPPEAIATGPAPPEAGSAAEALAAEPLAPPASAVEVLVEVDDVRFAWDLVDRLRFEPAPRDIARLVDGLAELTGVELPDGADPWTHYADLLLAWDVEAPPGYLDRKRALHAAHDPDAAVLFDGGAPIDWRRVTASGSGRDAAVALDRPAVVAPDSVDWLADDEVVFVVAVGDEHRAYPRRVLRAHELVDDVLGQRRIVVAWCEVCAAAVAWQVERSEGGSLDLAPSGLLLDGAPLAHDRASGSLVDTFRGEGVTGSLADGRPLEPVAVVTTTWEAWDRSAGTDVARSVVAEDGGIGRVYLDEPAPQSVAWPAGLHDPRLEADERVLGVRLPDGSPVAFPVVEARRRLDDGRVLRWSGVTVVADGGGLAALRAGSDDRLASHEATWRSWSRFHPDSEVWSPGS